MSTPMYDVPVHFLMPINDYGGGPELDPKKVVRTICWSCMPEEDWPCEAYRLENRWLLGDDWQEPDEGPGTTVRL